MSQELIKKRKLIESIDKKIILLLEKRIKILGDISIIKQDFQLDIHDKDRERVLLSNAHSFLKLKDKKAVMEIYKDILRHSLKFLLKKSKAKSRKYRTII